MRPTASHRYRVHVEQAPDVHAPTPQVPIATPDHEVDEDDPKWREPLFLDIAESDAARRAKIITLLREVIEQGLAGSVNDDCPREVPCPWKEVVDVLQEGLPVLRLPRVPPLVVGDFEEAQLEEASQGALLEHPLHHVDLLVWRAHMATSRRNRLATLREATSLELAVAVHAQRQVRSLALPDSAARAQVMVLGCLGCLRDLPVDLPVRPASRCVGVRAGARGHHGWGSILMSQVTGGSRLSAV